ncbi:MAG: 5-deoxy-glucuronate isomerase [Kiritimatiellae bacterium]|nr:5-deoxy-glucuronate isomerase [Kiritimatiellia bacterium]
MNYLRKYINAPGFTKIVKKNDMGLKLTEFGLIKLRSGEEYAAFNGANETALVVLGGRCRLQGDGFLFENVGDRKDVFSGKPHAVYLPCRTNYAIKALTNLEVAWTQSPAGLAAKPCHIRPEKVSSVSIGKNSFLRTAQMIIDEGFSSNHFIIGEAQVPAGNWASYPPHRHDFDNLPEEVDMEEIYFFRFNPEQGFGIQKIYTGNRGIDETYTIQNNDTVGIPQGYHPVACAPGYSMYYLWIMTGNNRRFLSYKDPAHAWVAAKG